MILKGSARSAPGELAYHLLREDTNESVRVLALWGVSSLDLPGALAELDGMGAGARSRRPLYHASINTPISEQLTADQQCIARERLAAKMGLEGQPYVVVEHVKAGRQHTHIVWSRIDQETGKAIPDSHNYRRHEDVARELEREFGHQHVLGAHIRDKATEPRPLRTPSWGEQRQAERSGQTPQEAKRQITKLWQQTKTGTEFMAALTAEGWSLARGDRRDFVLLDAAGEIHGLTRRIEGAKAKHVRERMADVDADRVPNVEEVRRQLQLRQQAIEQVGHELVRAAEMMNETEEENARLLRSAFERDAGAAVAQLRQTMGNELAGVILAEDRSRADKTPGQVLSETETIDDRRALELAARQAENLEPAHRRPDPENIAPDPAQQKQEGMARAGKLEPQRLTEPETQPLPPGLDQAQPKRSIWQRLFGRKPEAAQRSQEPLPDFRDSRAAPDWTPADIRTSLEAEKASEAKEEEQYRPSFHLFVHIFGAIIDAYQHALDRHTLERARIEDEKRRTWRDHATEKTAAPIPQRNTEPMPAITQEQESRQTREEALKRLRQQEDREDEEERERRLKL